MADATRLIPALKHGVKHRYRKLTTPKGPLGRVEKIRETLTALFKHERIELNHPRADEVRGYAERLISEAIRYGDCHTRTMELADYWIKEKQLVHKLFKVLAPRFATYEGSYTRLHILPTPFNDKFESKEPGPYYKYNWVALELKEIAQGRLHGSTAPLAPPKWLNISTATRTLRCLEWWLPTRTSSQMCCSQRHARRYTECSSQKRLRLSHHPNLGRHW
ncbi:mitochondrial ribosomal protein L17 isoform X1 [Dermacentor variabilis]|uniref:mitochondrial ribosomal protein L17 isoform X1 n=1 Tax=Dermacentor variabilis TaxID=34621 RepID=UPI003F5BA2E1